MLDNQIIAYDIDPNHETLTLDRGQLQNAWVETASAYRCLPLNIANQHGWAFYLKDDIQVAWNGSNGLDGITIYKNYDSVASSTFGHGVLTFSIDCVIRTSPHYNLHISGAPNFIKPGAHPLTGIYETDWAPYSFTMNWRLTDINRPVEFKAGDPICFFFPIPRNMIENMTLIKKPLYSDVDMMRAFHEFAESRSNFIQNGTNGNWQKHYFKGEFIDGKKCPYDDHKTKLNLKSISEK